jgi:hypothetical protein
MRRERESTMSRARNDPRPTGVALLGAPMIGDGGVQLGRRVLARKEAIWNAFCVRSHSAEVGTIPSRKMK